MAATDKQLGDLHQQVAKALSLQVQGVENDDGVVIPPSPALLGAAITFLKNNSITADAEDNEALRELNVKLSERRKRKIPASALDDAAAAYANTMGSGPLVLQ